MSLVKFKASKKAYVGHASRVLNSLEEEIQKVDIDEDLIQQLIEKAELKYAKVEEVSNKIQEATDDVKDIEDEVNSIDELLDRVLELKSKAKVKLKKKEKTEEGANQKTRYLQKNQGDEEYRESVRLPQLNIEKFTGDIEKYREFMDIFTVMIHKKKYEDVEKFFYLKSYLTGDAEKLIQGMSSTSANYHIALEILETNFGSEEVLINNHVSKLINLEKYDERNKTSLRVLFNKVNRHVRELETLNITSEMYSVFLVPIVLSKLSEELRKMWARSKKKGIANLLDLIQIEVESMESSLQVEMAFKCEEGNTRRPGPLNPNRSTSQQSSSVPSAQALSVQTRKRMCVFCNGNHYADECEETKRMSTQEVKDILQKENACLCCLKRGHHIVDCSKRNWLKCKICGSQNHNTLLHEGPNANVYISGAEGNANTRKPAILPQGRGMIVGPTGKQMEVNIMLDICSDKNFVTTEVSEQIGLKGHMEAMSITGITGITDESKGRGIVTATIKNRHHLEDSQKVQLVVVPQVCIPFTRAAISEKTLKSKYLKRLQLADDYSTEKFCKIDVLIGLPSYWAMVSGRIRRSKNNPIAMESMLGWVLVSDSVDEKTTNSTSVLSMFITTEESNEINDQLKRFWEVENIGGEDNVKGKWSQEDKNVNKQFTETIVFKEDAKRYQVALPMKEDCAIANNKSLALRRFSSLKQRFQKNEEFRQKYTDAMNEYIDAGFAERIQDEIEPADSYYIPHHAVIKEDRITTKVRLVLDGSSKEEGERSLNEVVPKGPALQPKSSSIIIRFRKHYIALNTDISKMYLMILVRLEDRDKLRFIWIDPVTKKNAIYRNTVLPFGLSCSPFLAIATVHHHLEKYEETNPDIVKELKGNMYIDDALTGTETEEEAEDVYHNSSIIMKEGGMDLVKWRSNSEKLVQIFRSDNVASPVTEKNIHEDEDISSTLLGIQWNSTNDTFHFKGDKLDHLLNPPRATKRSILKIAPKLYDPMGWINPFVVRAKVLFQSLWQEGYEWDENISPMLEKKWRKWLKELEVIKNIEIPRKYANCMSKHVTSRELHIFGDASKDAYGSVAYLKTYHQGSYSIRIVYAKSKVAPIKTITLPRLELLAAEMSSKMAQYVKEALEYPSLDLYLWTDSKISLHWIKGNSKQWKTFVHNRVQNIQQKSDPQCWRWCPGITNPADLVSRGMSAEDLVTSELWWSGPSWLKKDPHDYPNEMLKEEYPVEVLSERKEKTSFCFVQQSEKPDAECLAGKLIEPNRYSKWKTLTKTTAYITRYLYNLMHQPGSRKSASINTGDFNDAENLWLRKVQEENFPEEVTLLKNGGLVKRHSKLIHLSPYYNQTDGLIKMQGRIQYADLSEEEQHPIILPHNSWIVKLLVQDVHTKQLHAGVNQTLVAVRNRFWILKGRAVVRRVIKSCILCRKYAPVRLQMPMAPLPRDRVTRTKPFEVIGVDFTGPVYVVTPGGQCIKSYIALFTCATIRAIHLELVMDLTTDSFLRAFRRFVSRRGMCSIIYSDNALTFKKASKFLQQCHEVMNGKRFREYLFEHKIEWKFIPPRAPWWGGFYERLMRTIKEPLKKVLGRSSLSVDEMQTVLSEVEAMVNSRPLTFISDDANEASYLTPASFLIGRPVTSIPVKPFKGKEPDTNLTRKQLNHMLTMQNKHLNSLWKMFKEEYVRHLGTVPKKLSETNSLKVGELVMVTDNALPRCKWKLGVVDDVKEGRDHKIRQAWIRTADNIINRPIQHLSRLEMDSMEDYKEYRL